MPIEWRIRVVLYQWAQLAVSRSSSARPLQAGVPVRVVDEFGLVRGFEVTDDPSIVQTVYGDAPIWTGMGIIDFVVVPHVGSPNHAVSALLSQLASDYGAAAVPYRGLPDGEVLVIDGATCTII